MPNCIGEIVVTQPDLRQSRRISNHCQFAHAAALHIHATHSGHARKDRADLKARDVVQRRCVATFEVVADDREDRGRESLDLQIDGRRQIAAHGIDASLHLLQRELHVNAWHEGHIHFAAATD